MRRAKIDRPLTDVLDDLRPDQLIKVGCEHGSGWWYAGYAGDLAERLPDISKQLLEVTTAYRPRSPKTDKKKLIRNFKTLDRRNVVEIGMSLPEIDKGCVWLLIEGLERGHFWTTTEAEKLPSIHITGIIVPEEDRS